MKQKRRNRPLSVKITRDGVLTIEIGVDVLVFAALNSDYAWTLNGHASGRCPAARFSISDNKAFAVDVKRELSDEAEDGSSMLTNMIDEACQKAIEEGSQFWVDKEFDIT